MSPGPVRAFAPGRVNLIGEHTDYNAGLCLPFAIERGVTVSTEPIAGTEIVAHALDLSQRDSFALGPEIGPPHPGRPGAPTGWRRFVRGAAAELQREGIELRPCRVEIAGDVPRGAGLSSSAALSVALCLALCAAAELEPPEPRALARLCSRVERDWCGADTGLLDQLASLLGRQGKAVRLDMLDLSDRPVDLALSGHVLATLDSGASRSLAASGYNERRAECRSAAERLGVESLRELSPAGAVRDLPDPLDRRVRHVLSENERVDAAVGALEHGDLAALGELLDASHRSLRDDYEVSVPEVERAIRACKEAGAIGARIVGGGFGGSVLALFPPGSNPPQGAVVVEPSAGARLLGHGSRHI